MIDQLFIKTKIQNNLRLDVPPVSGWRRLQHRTTSVGQRAGGPGGVWGAATQRGSLVKVLRSRAELALFIQLEALFVGLSDVLRHLLGALAAAQRLVQQYHAPASTPLALLLRLDVHVVDQAKENAPLH